MQNCEKKNTVVAATAFSTLLTSFKPRQVLLNSKSTMKLPNENGCNKTLISLSPQQRNLLLQSICQFFQQQTGFSKTLKKLYKEADIDKDSCKSCILNLEEMCYHYLKMRNDTQVSDSAIKEQAANQNNDHVEENEDGEEEKSQGKIKNDPVDDVDVKLKKKKKRKSDKVVEETHSKSSKNPEDVSLSVPSEPQKKSKDKKKKHKDESHEERETLEKPDAVPQEEKKAKSKSKKKIEDALNPNDSAAEATEVDKEKKVSKKRKKSSMEEIETGCDDKASFDDSKRRKTVDQSNGIIPPKTPNGSANGFLETDKTKESQKNNKTKQLNGSAEQRTAANAFRRVKEEEVEFVDERLQDNSYWAKDGADSGYGAKAQEVLGQVRGRGFRHEKTKKKRGSYRGGQIDLQSHSIKFSYDDDE